MRTALAALVLVCACSPPPAEPSSQTVPLARASADVRIIDGDTFEYVGETFRLANIDTPEMPPRHRCDAEAALARLATQEMERLWAEAGPVEPVLRRDGLDRYGRTIVHLSLDGGRTDVGEVMVERGLAVAWAGRRHEWCS